MRVATVVGLAGLLTSHAALAQTPHILLEACNAMEPASKRLECLRAARGTSGGSAGANRSATAPQSIYSPAATAPRSTMPSTAATSRNSYSAGGRTCYVGPRSGTYTITASGRKNYSGC